jgi:hypothetical protein
MLNGQADILWRSERDWRQQDPDTRQGYQGFLTSGKVSALLPNTLWRYRKHKQRYLSDLGAMYFESRRSYLDKRAHSSLVIYYVFEDLDNATSVKVHREPCPCINTVGGTSTTMWHGPFNLEEAENAARKISERCSYGWAHHLCCYKELPEGFIDRVMSLGGIIRRGTEEQQQFAVFIEILSELEAKGIISGDEFRHYRKLWTDFPQNQESLSEQLRQLLNK